MPGCGGVFPIDEGVTPHRLLLSPRAARDLEDIAEDLAPGLRRAVHGRYLVLYRVLAADAVAWIERVVHGSRNLPRLV